MSSTARRQSRRQGAQPLLERDLQAVGHERDEDVRLDACVGPVVDRAEREVTFQFPERLLHLGQLQVESPQLGRIAARHVRPQQVAPFPAARLAQSLPVQAKAERLRRDGLVLVRQLDGDDPPGDAAPSTEPDMGSAPLVPVSAWLPSSAEKGYCNDPNCSSSQSITR